MNNPVFSIIIPVRSETTYLQETISHLQLQTFKSFETLVITDKISKTASPAQKRNLGASLAKGKYLAFLDDDSYPDKDWLQNAHKQFESHPTLAGVCGPCLTPPADNIYQQASGLVWSSYLGGGGAGVYRNTVSPPRFVDDYPSVNLIIIKKCFQQVGGFNTHHWPGEDTILCLDIVYQLKKQILYHPSIVVYHHRRPILRSHLNQIGRYAVHRGNFARVYPKTSLRIGYLVPSFFLIYLISLVAVKSSIFLFPLYLYLTLLTFTFINFLFNQNKFIVATLATITIPITHLYYGLLFIIGFLKPQLSFTPRPND